MNIRLIKYKANDAATGMLIEDINKKITNYNEKNQTDALSPLEKVLYLDQIKLLIDKISYGNVSIDNSRKDIYAELNSAEGFTSIYLATSAGNTKIPTESEWKKGSIIITSNSKNISLILRNFQKQSETSIEDLTTLQQETLSFIRKNSLDKSEPLSIAKIVSNSKLKKYFYLLEAVSFELFQLQNEKQLIYSQLTEKDGLRNFAHQLNQARTDPQNESLKTIILEKMPDIAITYLNGRNNVNWKIEDTNPSHTPYKGILRIEPENHTSYQLRREVINNPQLKQHLSNESFYCTIKVPGNREILSDEDKKNPDKKPPDETINLAATEYYERGNIGYALYRENQFYLTVFNVSSCLVQQVAEICQDFLKAGVVYADIKAENFLIKNDGKVITADLKSIKEAKGGLMNLTNIACTELYKPPETKTVNGSDLMDAEAYMSYQIGLMHFMLIKGYTNRPDITQYILNAKDNDLNLVEQQNIDKLNFKTFIFKNEEIPNPVFSTDEGKNIESFIRSCLSKDYEKRPKLAEIIKKCQKLRENFPEYEVKNDRFLPQTQQQPSSNPMNQGTLSKSNSSSRSKKLHFSSSLLDGEKFKEQKELKTKYGKEKEKESESEFISVQKQT